MPATPTSEAMKWEYDFDPCDTVSELTGRLAGYGDQGWELIQVVHAPYNFVAIYKRPLAAGSKETPE
jgi:hypothetical protein